MSSEIQFYLSSYLFEIVGDWQWGDAKEEKGADGDEFYLRASIKLESQLKN